MKFEIEPKALTVAVRHLNSLIERRNTIPALSCIMLQATAPDSLTLSATDLDAQASVTLAATVEADGVVLLDGWALASMLKPAAKADSIAFDGGTDSVGVAYGRARYHLSIPAAWQDYPVISTVDLELVELSDDAEFVCPVEGFEANAKAAKLFGKLVRPAKGQVAPPVEIETYSTGRDAVRMVAKVAGWTITAKAGEAGYAYKTAKRDPFAHRMCDGGYAAAQSYLVERATARGFDLDALAVVPDYGEDREPATPTRLAVVDGLVMGATFGDVTRYARKAGEGLGEYREATPAEIDSYCYRFGEGCRGMIERDGIELKADRDSPAQYAPGSFSIPMPRENAAIAAAVAFSQADEAGNWSPWQSVRTTEAGKLDWAALPDMADLFGAPSETASTDIALSTTDMAETSTAPVPAVDAPELVEAPQHPAPVETPPAPAVAAPVAISGDVVAALVARIEALENDAAVRAAIISAASNVGAKVIERAPRAVRERIVRAYLRIRQNRALLRSALATVNGMNATLTQERDAAAARVERLESTVADQARRVEQADKIATDAIGQITRMGEQLNGATRRGDRLANLAREQRKRAERHADDMRAVRAESAAHARRAADARAQLATLNITPTTHKAPALAVVR